MLNIKQKDIVESAHTNMLVIAGAGTGKTRVLIERIKQYLKKGILAESILALTFTKKAADEMKKRLGNQRVLVCTFDSLCYLYVNERKPIQIIEDAFTKSQMMAFNRYQVFKKDKPEDYEAYVLYKKKYNVIDFYDLEEMFLEYLDPETFPYRYILIDEFQDTSELQFLMMKKLVDRSCFFVVGDPDQSIYSFRGAQSEVIDKYRYYFNPTLKVMDTNYRSTKQILYHANHLIQHNSNRYKKVLQSPNNEKSITGFKYFDTEKEELEWIVFWINRIFKTSPLDHVAILFRTHQRGENAYQELSDDPRISLLTFHEAKGLEFDWVIILDISQETLFSFVPYEKKAIEEERRLMFVALTRAKKHVVVTTIQKNGYFIREAKLKAI